MFALSKTLLLGSLMVLGPHAALAQTDAIANVQKKVLTLAGARTVYGFRQEIMGRLQKS